MDSSSASTLARRFKHAGARHTTTVTHAKKVLHVPAKGYLEPWCDLMITPPVDVALERARKVF